MVLVPFKIYLNKLLKWPRKQVSLYNVKSLKSLQQFQDLLCKKRYLWMWRCKGLSTPAITIETIIIAIWQLQRYRNRKRQVLQPYVTMKRVGGPYRNKLVNPDLSYVVLRSKLGHIVSLAPSYDVIFLVCFKRCFKCSYLIIWRHGIPLDPSMISCRMHVALRTRTAKSGLCKQ